jgi:integrase
MRESDRLLPMHSQVFEALVDELSNISWLDDLPEWIPCMDCDILRDMTFLVNDLKRPFTAAGFGNKFREWCDQAGLRHCSAHGLRKAGATIAANNGATAHQLMAMFGWSTLKMAEEYTRKADQEKLARAAMHLIETPEQNSTETCPTEQPSGTFSAKSEAKSKPNFRDGAQERTRTSTPRGAST